MYSYRRLALLSLTLAACSKEPVGTIDPGLTQTKPNIGGVYLRAVFDADPSTYIGGFVTSEYDRDNLDEAKGMKTQCSPFIKPKVVAASGSMTNSFDTTRSIRAQIGIPRVMSAEYEHGDQSGVRAEYTMTERMQSVIEDPEGFARCCAQNAGACGEFYISEFTRGSGAVEYNKAAVDSVGASGGTATVQAGGGYEWEKAWTQASTFEDMYFSFRITPVPKAPEPGTVDECAWANDVPTSATGKYFVGIGGWSIDEGESRRDAQQRARADVVRHLFGEAISTTSESSTSAGVFESQSVISAASSGIAKGVEEQKSCVEREDSPEGPKAQVKVLMFVANEDMKEQTRAVLEVARVATPPESAERAAIDAALAEGTE